MTCLVCQTQFRYDSRSIRWCDTCRDLGQESCQRVLQHLYDEAAIIYEATLAIVIGTNEQTVERWTRFLDEYHTTLRIGSAWSHSEGLSEKSVIALERKIRLAINKGDLIGTCISAFVAFRSIEKRKIGFDEDWYEATVEYKKKEGPA